MRWLILLAVIVGFLNIPSTAGAHASCLSLHPQAVTYCTAVQHRKVLRYIRHRQVVQVHRAHVRFKRSYYRGWNVRRLAAARRWEASRLRYLRRLPTWWPTDPRALGRMLVARAGWLSEWVYVDKTFSYESGWQVHDPNGLGCDGIGQACPAEKQAAAGPDWRTSAKTQIIWALGYIRSRYGSPRAAWQHELDYGWY